MDAAVAKLISDAGRVVEQEVARAASRVIGIGDLGSGGTGRAVVVTGEVVAVVGIAAIGQPAPSSVVAAKPAGGSMVSEMAVVKPCSIAHIDSLAAGGGADDEQGERAEEASLHGRCTLKDVGQAGQGGPAEKGLVGRPA